MFNGPLCHYILLREVDDERNNVINFKLLGQKVFFRQEDLNTIMRLRLRLRCSFSLKRIKPWGWDNCTWAIGPIWMGRSWTKSTRLQFWERWGCCENLTFFILSNWPWWVERGESTHGLDRVRPHRRLGALRELWLRWVDMSHRSLSPKWYV